MCMYRIAMMISMAVSHIQYVVLYCSMPMCTVLFILINIILYIPNFKKVCRYHNCGKIEK